MGRIAVPLMSFNTTMGRLLNGSIISPRIFISTSMWSVSPPLSVYTLARERVWPGASDANVDILAEQIVCRCGPQEIQSLVLRGAADPLPGGFIEALDQAFFHAADVIGIAADLNVALQFLKHQQAPGFLFLGNLIRQRERRSVGASRILEAEDGIVFDLPQQRQRRFEV